VDPDENINDIKFAHNLPRQDRNLCLAPTEPTHDPVRSSEGFPSYPSFSSKEAAWFPASHGLTQNASHEDPLAIDDHTHHDDFMAIDSINCNDQMVVDFDAAIDATNDQATLENVSSSSGISLPPIRQLFNPSMKPQEDPSRGGHLPTHMEYPSASPLLEPCMGETMISISEPDSDLMSAVGSHTFSHERSWMLDHSKQAASAPVLNVYIPPKNYDELQDRPEPEEMLEYAYGPLDEVEFPIERCDQCDKTFRGRYRKGNLRRHNTAFHSPLALVGSACRICKKAYKRTDATRKHEWKKHRLSDAMPKKRLQ